MSQDIYKMKLKVAHSLSILWWMWLICPDYIASQERSPNILMIITDDMDLLLGGVVSQLY